MMRQLAVLGLLVWQAAGQSADQPPVAQPQHMRYMRAVQVQGASGQACAVLDAQIFPHAAPSLADLRLFPAAAGAHEVPYAITISRGLSENMEEARILNLGMQGGKVVFDLEMPQRPYTSVMLALDPFVHDFLATATVTGEDAPGTRGNGRSLGTFTLFDLSSQHLSRYTTLPLQESTFRYLHIVLSISPAPGAQGGPRLGTGLVQRALVPPSREAQIIYTTVAETSQIVTTGRESIATIEIPARVPVERVEFALSPSFKANFSRDVRVSATAEPAPKLTAEPALSGQAQADLQNGRRVIVEKLLPGNILRVHATEAGRDIQTEQLSVPAILGANLQRAAKVVVAIENGDDQPLPIATVRLEMRQRKLCFDASAVAAGALNLYYGDDRLQAPVYDYARLFSAARSPAPAMLGPEQQNPNYQPPADTRSFTDRHPEVLWIALIVVICVLGAVAVRASKNVGR